jgi:hypothetical protein
MKTQQQPRHAGVAIDAVLAFGQFGIGCSDCSRRTAAMGPPAGQWVP